MNEKEFMDAMDELAILYPGAKNDPGVLWLNRVDAYHDMLGGFSRAVLGAMFDQASRLYFQFPSAGQLWALAGIEAFKRGEEEPTRNVKLTSVK